MRLLKRLYRRYQSFVWSGAMLVASALLLLLGILPVGIKVNDMRTTVNDLETKITSLTDKANGLDSLDERTLSKDLVDLISALPSNKSVQTIFLTSEVLLSQSGVTASTVSIQSPGSIASGSATAQTNIEKTTGASKLAFSFSGRGTYEQTKTLLRTVHAVRRIVTFDKLQLGFGKDGNVSMQVELTTFYKPLSNSVPSADSVLPKITQEDAAVIKKIAGFPWLSQPVANITARINAQPKADPFSP